MAAEVAQLGCPVKLLPIPIFFQGFITTDKINVKAYFNAVSLSLMWKVFVS